MAKAAVEEMKDIASEAGISRVYEIGYHINPSVKEEDVEKVVGEIRAEIEKNGGSFIAEGAPLLTRLAYPIDTIENGKRMEYDRGYFGWLKFEAPSSASDALDTLLTHSKHVLRHILFRTVREETRARLKAPTLREVRRTDTLKTTPRREEDAAATPVSEADLEKALEDITAD